MTKKSKWNNDEEAKEERAMWLMIKERKDYYLWIMRMTKKKQEQRRCVQKEDRSERWGEERTYKMEQSAMWQGADGARKKRFTLWLLAVSSSLLHIHWQHIHTHHCHCQRCSTACLCPAGIISVFWRGVGGCFLSFAHSCWVRMCVYQAMSSRYPTTISTLLEDDTISKLKGCSLIHKEAPQQVTLHVWFVRFFTPWCPSERNPARDLCLLPGSKQGSFAC